MSAPSPRGGHLAQHDHGGSLAERTQWLVDGLAVDVERHGLDLELVLVEWNRPRVGPLWRRHSSLRSGHGFGFGIITVPREVHNELAGAQSLPMLQFVAKNVDIRRAAGRFVLATNIDDVLLSAELAAALAEPLARGCLYRVDRHDVEFPFRDVHDVDEALAFCADHPLR